MTALPWRAKTLDFLKPESRLLMAVQTADDLEFLLSLRHPFAQTAALAHAALYAQCKKRLEPLGVAVELLDDGVLPFADGSFSLILWRYAPYSVSQLHRVLMPGGYLLTEQVGGGDLARLCWQLSLVPARPAFNLENERQRFLRGGFTVNYSDQRYLPIAFAHADALRCYARETGNAPLEAALTDENLCKLKALPEYAGGFCCTTHRFMLIVRRAR